MKTLTATKKHALSRGTLACLGDVATVNVMRGCGAACTFCHARCYPGAPAAGTLLLYRDLANQLRQELDSTRRKRPLPRFVLFGTACDPFIGGAELHELSRACLEVLLRRQIGVSLCTRGDIPAPIIELLSAYAGRVQLAIPLASMSADYTRTWEPGTTLPDERLFLFQRLRDAGLAPQMRLEPMIPFVNDRIDDLHALTSAIVGVGQREAIASFIHLRPGVAEQLAREAPAAARRLVLGAFPSRQYARPADFDHLPASQTLPALRRLQRIGREHGVRIGACRCQNPGLPASRCPLLPADLPDAAHGQQAELF